LKRAIGVLILAVALALGAGLAQAETENCTPVTVVPTTISVAGIYCLTGDILSALAGGSAIEIASNNVVLDLNGHRLSNLGAGPSNLAVGVLATGRQNVTIKNGTIRGFYSGVRLDGNTQAVVEGIRFDRNYGQAVYGLICQGSLIRDNLITNTGGRPEDGASATAIFVGGLYNRVINNDIVNVIKSGQGTATGIYFGSIPTDGFAVNNRITSADFGISINANTKYRDNLTTNVATPYFGGINAGNNQ
jgi:hypothetical protein